MPLQRCNLCSKRVNFVSIRKSLGLKLGEHGFPHGLDKFETLNYRRYACPNCGSGDRDRLYRLYFNKFIKYTKAPIKLVDFAPSDSLQKYLKEQPMIQYRSADLYMDNVDDKIDITDMHQYKDNRFDFFICSHILEHVDDKAALSELFRIIKPGGKGILMTPIIKVEGAFDEDLNITDVSERWRRFAQDDHVRLYTKAEFLKRVEQAGFIVRQYTWKDLGLMNFIKYGISIKSVLYIVEKNNV